MVSSRALCRIHFITSTPAHAQALVALLASALRLPTGTTPASTAAAAATTQLDLGNALLEIHALPSWVATARHSGFLNRPVLSRLCGVEVFSREGGAPPAAVPTSKPAAGDDARAWLIDDHPMVTPTLSMAASLPLSRDPDPSPPPLVKEIVLGAGSRWNELTTVVEEDIMPQAQPLPNLPHVYALGNTMSSSSSLPSTTIAMRLLPSIVSALVLQVPGGMAKAKDDLWRRQIQFEEIGSTGASEGQVLLSSPLLRGLDIRLADGEAAISPFFNEGTEVLNEGVFKELNPTLDRPLEGGNATQGTVPAAAYQRSNHTGMGDCWSEFRTQLRRPSGFFSSSSK